MGNQNQPTGKIHMAAIQMASGPNVGANLIEARRLIAQAVRAGANMVVLPENFAIMGMKESDKVDIREQDGNGPIQDFLIEQAAKNNVWLVGGTVPLVADAPDKVRAACMVYDNTGKRVARYDKAHLFDVSIEDTGERYIESETIEAGGDIVVVDTPFAKLGLAVCYDLRFPELFRNMLNHQVEVIVIPSAFTAITGSAHWEVLVRARAIENLCYVVAADQGGYHVNGRESYGDSMIVDPWGHVLDRLSSGSGFVMGEIDLNYLRKTRRNFPALQHRKLVCNVN
jgi:nitrilase